MRKVLASIVLLCMACLNAQCQKAEVHKNDGTTVEIPVEDIDSITFSMTNPFNFETRMVKLKEKGLKRKRGGKVQFFIYLFHLTVFFVIREFMPPF